MKVIRQFLLVSTDAFDKAQVDNPTIGLLLCKTKNHLVAEYALSGIGKPIGIAEYQLVRALPEPLDTCLSSIEEIEAELGRIGEDWGGGVIFYCHSVFLIVERNFVAYQHTDVI